MYLNPKQAAAALKMSRQWLYELINRGEIGTSEIAGRRLILEDERFKALRKERAKMKAAA
jgi:predicted site-specific integrase-resolvase